MSHQATNSTEPLTSTNFQTASKLIIAIDFGTTYTGVAYIHSGPQHGSDAADIAQRIIIIRNWPSPSNHTSDKTPSVIAYNTDPPTWGGKVEPHNSPILNLGSRAIAVRSIELRTQILPVDYLVALEGSVIRTKNLLISRPTISLVSTNTFARSLAQCI
jgi:hypothetical protein